MNVCFLRLLATSGTLRDGALSPENDVTCETFKMILPLELTAAAARYRTTVYGAGEALTILSTYYKLGLFCSSFVLLACHAIPSGRWFRQ
jgi:hypothetical protein